MDAVIGHASAVQFGVDFLFYCCNRSDLVSY